jgi:hypothetical protein
MAKSLARFGTFSVWVQHTGENAVGYACAAALGVLPGVADHAASWSDVALAAGIGALTAVLTAGAALRVNNGTDSFNPRVVAAPNVAPDA